MKKLKLLLQAGVIETNSKLKSLYKKYKASKKALVRTEKMHAEAKKNYKALETNLNTDQLELEMAYMLRMEAKHLRIASEYAFLYAETALELGMEKVIKSVKTDKPETTKKTKEAKPKADKKVKNAEDAQKTIAEKVESPKKVKKTKKKETKKVQETKPEVTKKVKTKKPTKQKKEKKETEKKESNKATSTTIVTSKKTTIYDPFNVKTEAVNTVKEVSVKETPAAKKIETPKAKIVSTSTKKTTSTAPKKVAKPSTTKKATVKKVGEPVAKKTIVKTTSKKIDADKVDTNNNTSDNLRLIEGVGPAAERNLIACGFSTFASIAKSTPEELYDKLTAISQRMAVLALGSFPAQAALAAAGKFDELEELKKTLNRGR